MNPTEPQSSYICDLCYPNWIELASFSDLAFGHNPTTDEYAILGGQGHDTLVNFTIPPTPDPLPDNVLDAMDEADEPTTIAPVWEHSDPISAWVQEATENTHFLGKELLDHWRFVETLRSLGYNPDIDGTAEIWLFSYCGALRAALALTNLAGGTRVTRTT